jgi:hypothetical protein
MSEELFLRIAAFFGAWSGLFVFLALRTYFTNHVKIIKIGAMSGSNDKSVEEIISGIEIGRGKKQLMIGNEALSGEIKLINLTDDPPKKEKGGTYFVLQTEVIFTTKNGKWKIYSPSPHIFMDRLPPSLSDDDKKEALKYYATGVLATRSWLMGCEDIEDCSKCTTCDFTDEDDE